jgi:hypothetical protein
LSCGHEHWTGLHENSETQRDGERVARARRHGRGDRRRLRQRPARAAHLPERCADRGQDKRLPRAHAADRCARGPHDGRRASDAPGDLLSLDAYGNLQVAPGRVIRVVYDGLPGNPAVQVRFK